MLSATVALNRNGSSLTTAIAARSEATSTSRTSAPPTSAAPALTSDRRGMNCTRVVRPEPGQEPDERVVVGLQARADHGVVPHPCNLRAEALELAVLARERLDHAHAADVLLDVGGQLADALLELLQRRARASPVARGDE